MRFSRSALCAVALSVVANLVAMHPIDAQDSRNTGPVVGLNASTSTMRISSIDRGYGGAATVGWGVTRWLMPYFTYDRMQMNSTVFVFIGEQFLEGKSRYAQSSMDAGVRLSVPRNWRWSPYVNLAITRRELSDFRNSFDGEFREGPDKTWSHGRTLGAGVQFFVSRNMAFDFGLQQSSGAFNKSRSNGVVTTNPYNSNLNTTRGSLGLKFYPHLGGR